MPDSLILGIETSCDETAAAVVRGGRDILSNVVATQHDLHKRFTGVVPEIASRAHVQRLLPVLDEALRLAGATSDQLDAVAVGNRPGLVGSLIVGVTAAQSLAWSLAVPLLGVDHVQAHLYAPLLTDGGLRRHGRASLPPSREQPESAARREARPPKPGDDVYPAVGLVVSGGHTTLYRVDGPLHLTRLGKTIDDAAGEAFDKAAVMLDAGYPGGPAIQRLAEAGNAAAIDPPLPEPLKSDGSLDVSFSGLKTALLYRVRGQPVGRGRDARFERDASDLTDQQRADLAAAFQDVVVRVLVGKLRAAADQIADDAHPARCVLLGGGVSANGPLRGAVQAMCDDLAIPLHLPPLPLCVDNAVMIGGLAHHRFIAGQTDPLDLPAIATTAM